MPKGVRPFSTARENVVFEPLPWQVAPWYDYSPVMLLTGSAGGGKSRLAYEKLHAFMLRYPGANGLALRKARTDAEKSVVVTLDDLVIGNDPNVTKNIARHMYHYRNGSRLWWGGMKGKEEREAIRSIGSGGALDVVLMEEGTQFDEQDFQEIVGRMRGRAAPWRQIIIATNPDGPYHWINRRLIIGGEASVHISSVHDNIYLDDGYRNQLDRMTGVQGARLARGLWVEGSGLVIDRWLNRYNKGSGSDGGGNVTLEADYLVDAGRVVMFADDGYAGEWDSKAEMFTAQSHPRVFLLAQIRYDGTINVFYESYRVKTSYGAHIDEVLAECVAQDWPRPSEVHYDKAAAALRGELAAKGFDTLYRGTQNKDQSIKFMNEHIGPDENGRRMIRVHPRCRQLVMEMSSWSYRDGVPMKTMDHGPDALRYGIWNLLNGTSQEGAVGVRSESDEIARRVEERMRKIDQVMDRVDRAYAGQGL